MKKNTFILSSILCAGVVFPAIASECIGDGCDIAPTPTISEPEIIMEPTVVETDDYVECDTCESDDEWVEIFSQTITDLSATRARVDEILAPMRPMGNIWANNKQSIVPNQISVASDLCPFNNFLECSIWRKKPMVNETVSPRSPRLRTADMTRVINAVTQNPNISANAVAMAPLVARYKMLMNTSNACCTDSLVYTLHRAGADNDLIYKFMIDDANFYGFGARCVVMSDDELDTRFASDNITHVAADIRNGCLCRNRAWYNALLAPFKTAYNESFEFAAAPFEYTYTDGLKREITVSINTDVQNVMAQLDMCP